jgi:hypothetical protein
MSPESCGTMPYFKGLSCEKPHLSAAHHTAAAPSGRENKDREGIDERDNRPFTTAELLRGDQGPE